jgi:hypothetical protein
VPAKLAAVVIVQNAVDTVAAVDMAVVVDMVVVVAIAQNVVDMVVEAVIAQSVVVMVEAVAVADTAQIVENGPTVVALAVAETATVTATEAEIATIIDLPVQRNHQKSQIALISGRFCSIVCP